MRARIMLAPELIRFARDRRTPLLVFQKKLREDNQLMHVDNGHIMDEWNQILVDRRPNLLQKHAAGKDRLRDASGNDSLIVNPEPPIIERQFRTSQYTRKFRKRRRLGPGSVVKLAERRDA